VCVCARARACACVFARALARVCACVRVCVCACVRVCARACLYINMQASTRLGDAARLRLVHVGHPVDEELPVRTPGVFIGCKTNLIYCKTGMILHHRL
jgi:hypothetical protein